MKTVFGLEPLTTQAEWWLEENVYYDAWQKLLDIIYVDWSSIDDIVTGMLDAGLVAGEDFKVV